MTAKAQSASHAGAGQNITSRAAARAVPFGAVRAGLVPSGAPDAVTTATPGAAARPAASAAASATAAAVAPLPPAVPAPVTVAAPTAVPAPVTVAAPTAVPASVTPPARSAPAAPSSTWQANLSRLERLAEVLSHRGLRARLMTPPGRVPSLHVVNPSAAALAEDVYAGRGQDGLWWFWWSWAERITVGEDLEGAASRIEHVLAAS
jgi:hypothetical protein